MLVSGHIFLLWIRKWKVSGRIRHCHQKERQKCLSWHYAAKTVTTSTNIPTMQNDGQKQAQTSRHCNSCRDKVIHNIDEKKQTTNDLQSVLNPVHSPVPAITSSKKNWRQTIPWFLSCFSCHGVLRPQQQHLLQEPQRINMRSKKQDTWLRFSTPSLWLYTNLTLIAAI